MAKEKKQQDIKFKYIEKAGIEDFVTQLDSEGSVSDSTTRAFVDQLKDRISVVRQNDATLKEFAKEEKKKSKPSKPKALELFMGA